MITQKDIEKLKKIFATKKDLRNLKNEMVRKFVTKIEFQSAIKELTEFITILYEKTINEIRNLRRDTRAILDNHEFRIKRLEKTSSCKNRKHLLSYIKS